MYAIHNRPAWRPSSRRAGEQAAAAGPAVGPLFSQSADEAAERPMVRVRFVNTPDGKDVLAVAKEGDNLMKVLWRYIKEGGRGVACGLCLGAGERSVVGGGGGGGGGIREQQLGFASSVGGCCRLLCSCMRVVRHAHTGNDGRQVIYKPQPIHPPTRKRPWTGGRQGGPLYPTRLLYGPVWHLHQRPGRPVLRIQGRGT
jgi:hypothetical protein